MGPRSRASPAITLSEHDGVRYLHFDSPWIQGAMSLRHPSRIEIDYVAQMMSWLLFLGTPTHVLQLGLGAGALTRWGLRHLAATTIDVVEISDAVIRAAHEHFALPPRDPRLRIHHADAQQFIAQAAERTQRWSVIQADLYDEAARGPVCDSLAFYRDCRAILDPGGGVLIVNLFGEQATFGRNLRRIERVFDDRVLCLPPVPAGNIVALAFSGPPIDVPADRLLARAADVEKRWRLPARSWARALARGDRLTL